MLIDYAWYWNHRLLHSRTMLWNFHMVHHAADHLDVLASARNSFWSPVLMVYMWSFSLILFLAKSPTNFLLIASFGLIINFRGHTNFNFKRDGVINKVISQVFITPLDHFWHHSTENSYCNFGTFFNFWDRIHGTFHSPDQLPKKLGFPINMKTWKQLFFPFN
jgi:sterol desaturase/sphingolipid hydroxylase (fatty acid hydroxylase superfamily)